MRPLLTTLTMCCLPALAWAATVVVSPSGDDSNPCVASAPCRTLNRAVSRMTGGDTLLVKAGTYNEALADVLPSGPDAAHPTRLVSETPGGAILAPDSVPGVGILDIVSKQNMTVEGMVFDASRQTQHYNVIVYLITRNCQGPMRNLTFQNNEVRGLPTLDWGSNGGAGIKTGQYPTGCLDDWSNVVIKGNHIHDIAAGGTDNHVHGLYMSAPNVEVVSNEIDHVEAYGIQTFTTQNQTDDSVYMCNYVHDTNARGGIMLGSGERLKAIKNRVERTGGNGIDGCVGFGPCDGYVIQDNVLVGNRGSCVTLNGAQGAAISGNTCSGNGNDGVQEYGSGGTQIGSNQMGGTVSAAGGMLAGCGGLLPSIKVKLPAPKNLRLITR